MKNDTFTKFAIIAAICCFLIGVYVFAVINRYQQQNNVYVLDRWTGNVFTIDDMQKKSIDKNHEDIKLKDIFPNYDKLVKTYYNKYHKKPNALDLYYFEQDQNKSKISN